MAYSSRDGRKPMERASKIAHAQVINDPSVRALLARCRVPRPPGDATELSLLEVPEIPAACTISTVIAVDGGSTEASIREEFPSASVTFFNFGPLLLSLNDLRALDVQEFIFPEDLRKLKKIERFTLAMPTRNVALEGSLARATRRWETLFAGCCSVGGATACRCPGDSHIVLTHARGLQSISNRTRHRRAVVPTAVGRCTR
jgi:hypothetical protein